VPSRITSARIANSLVYAIADEDLARENKEKTSSVHFLRFEFEPAMINAFKRGVAVALGVDHAGYAERVDEIAPEVQAALAKDFA
jgi:glycerol-3-phosphate dehydrogenase subunit C